MRFRKCLFLAACLMISEADVSARPLPEPEPQGAAQALNKTPPAPPPVQHADRSLPSALFSPEMDLLLLAALGWWLWRMQRHRGEEGRFFTASEYDEVTADSPAPLRTVAYPSDAQNKELLRFRDQWIEEFRSLQLAWVKHDLRPVYGIISPQIRRELEAEVRRFSSKGRDALPELELQLAEPADSWREDGAENVTVHFAGNLRDARRPGSEREFDEFWTFSRPWHEPQSGVPEENSWIVTTIRRGNRERSLPRLA